MKHIVRALIKHFTPPTSFAFILIVIRTKLSQRLSRTKLARGYPERAALSSFDRIIYLPVLQGLTSEARV
jgi:hypothetical protein